MLHREIEDALGRMAFDGSEAIVACAVYTRLHTLVFENLTRLAMVDCFIRPTYRMVLASRFNRPDGERIATHPAPRSLVPAGLVPVEAPSMRRPPQTAPPARSTAASPPKWRPRGTACRCGATSARCPWCTPSTAGWKERWAAHDHLDAALDRTIRLRVEQYFRACNEVDETLMRQCAIPTVVHYVPNAPGPIIGIGPVLELWGQDVERNRARWAVDEMHVSAGSAATAWCEWTSTKPGLGAVLRGADLHVLEPEPPHRIREVRIYYAVPWPRSAGRYELPGFDYGARGWTSPGLP